MLRIYGEALFGSRWQSELARALGVTPRHLARWLDSTRSMPERVSDDLAKLKAERLRLIQALPCAFDSQPGPRGDKPR